MQTQNKTHTHTTNNTFHTNEQITNNNFRHSLSSQCAPHIFVYLWTSKWWYSISKCYRNPVLSYLILTHSLSLSPSYTSNVSSSSSFVSLLRFVFSFPSIFVPIIRFHFCTCKRTHARTHAFTSSVLYLDIDKLYNKNIPPLQYAKTRTNRYVFFLVFCIYLFILFSTSYFCSIFEIFPVVVALVNVHISLNKQRYCNRWGQSLLPEYMSNIYMSNTWENHWIKFDIFF